jgi:hypothetical protein
VQSTLFSQVKEITENVECSHICAVSCNCILFFGDKRTAGGENNDAATTGYNSASKFSGSVMHFILITLCMVQLTQMAQLVTCPWYKIFLEQSIIIQLVKGFPVFMESEGSSLLS